MMRATHFWITQAQKDNNKLDYRQINTTSGGVGQEGPQNVDYYQIATSLGNDANKGLSAKVNILGTQCTDSAQFRILSEAVGSKKTSEHCCIDSAAADFELFGIDNKLTAQFIQAELDYNQLILEHYSPPNGGWIHCSYRIEGNKKKAMHAFKEDGKTVYKEGLWH